MSSIDIQTIKKDQVFYECSDGYNFEYTAISDAYPKDGGYQVDTIDSSGERGSVFCHSEYSFYLKLYSEPQYCYQDESDHYLNYDCKSV
jgi:hypothetical protein